MICYRDKTFCTATDCKKFGDSCHRSLTEEVKQAAYNWWGDEDAPIAIFAETPSCFEPIEGNKDENT